MSKEMVWLILPIAGILSQLGGSPYVGKWIRRYGIPIISVATAWLFIGYFYWGFIPMALHLWGAFCLPVTLFGDSIPKDWRNWAWLPVWGIIMCSSILWLSFSYWLVAVICGIIVASLVMLSNIPKMAKYFQWKYVEMCYFLALVPLCYFITLQ